MYIYTYMLKTKNKMHITPNENIAQYWYNIVTLKYLYEIHTCRLKNCHQTCPFGFDVLVVSRKLRTAALKMRWYLHFGLRREINILLSHLAGSIQHRELHPDRWRHGNNILRDRMEQWQGQGQTRSAHWKRGVLHSRFILNTYRQKKSGSHLADYIFK